MELPSTLCNRAALLAKHNEDWLEHWISDNQHQYSKIKIIFFLSKYLQKIIYNIKLQQQQIKQKILTGNRHKVYTYENLLLQNKNKGWISHKQKKLKLDTQVALIMCRMQHLL